MTKGGRKTRKREVDLTDFICAELPFSSWKSPSFKVRNDAGERGERNLCNFRPVKAPPAPQKHCAATLIGQ